MKGSRLHPCGPTADRIRYRCGSKRCRQKLSTRPTHKNETEVRLNGNSKKSPLSPELSVHPVRKSGSSPRSDSTQTDSTQKSASGPNGSGGQDDADKTNPRSLRSREVLFSYFKNGRSSRPCFRSAGCLYDGDSFRRCPRHCRGVPPAKSDNRLCITLMRLFADLS